MIVTVTLNPSLDYIVTADGFELGRTNRTSSELVLPGGKGINVSVVLKALGFESTALGFVAGFSGEEIRRLAKENGIGADFITLSEGNSRINLKLINIDGTELNGMGPVIPPESAQELFARLDKLNGGDVLVLSGSVPGSMPEDTYRQIMERLEDRGVLVCVDASGKQLANVLSCHPFLIKPNLTELEEVTGIKGDIRTAVQKLKKEGARNVLVSMGGSGAVLFAEDGRIFKAGVPEGTLVNSVGAGDSMVAGFLAGWLTEGDCEKAFRLAVAAGSASAYSDRLATGEEILRLYEHVTVKMDM